MKSQCLRMIPSAGRHHPLLFFLMSELKELVQGPSILEGSCALEVFEFPEELAGVLCGGNIDVNMISRIIERGLVGDGRMTHLIVKVRDRPGSLSFLTDLVAGRGANVLDIHHRRGFADISVGAVEIVLQIETRGRDHVAEIIQALEEKGVKVEVDV